MLRSLVIDNFRSFEHFELGGLGRINLLVGSNNSGKTSVLEAIYLLAAREAPALFTIGAPRGERTGTEVGITHLFHGRAAASGTRFAVAGEGLGSFVAEISPLNGSGGHGNLTTLRAGPGTHASTAIEDSMSTTALELAWEGHPAGSQTYTLPISARQTVSTMVRWAPEAVQRVNVEFLSTVALEGDRILKLLGEVLLNPEEEHVTNALRTIDPSIQQLGLVPVPITGTTETSRSGVVVRCAGIERRVPIGTMGDGIWRLLGIALWLAATRDGFLLIDEIDTGLHYSVMEKMWTLVLATAKRLNVQVFATAHSRDCYEALAAISRADAGDENEISIQRIEKGKTHAVAFTEPEIVIAAKRGIEVR